MSYARIKRPNNESQPYCAISNSHAIFLDNISTYVEVTAI